LPPVSAGSATRDFTFFVASGRREGNTEWLARKAAEELTADATQQWLHLSDLPLPPFEDIRHTIGVYPEPQGNERVLFPVVWQSAQRHFDRQGRDRTDGSIFRRGLDTTDSTG
jgi:hypothetical protein